MAWWGEGETCTEKTVMEGGPGGDGGRGEEDQGFLPEFQLALPGVT